VRLGVQKATPTKTPGGVEGSWWTPEKLAAKTAAWANVRAGDDVVDAGAGRGALSRAFDCVGGNVTAVEIDATSVRALREERGLTRFTVVHHDFLSWDPGRIVDIVATNPIWEGDWCDLFLLRATEIARRTIGVLPLNLLAGVERHEGLWRRVQLRRVVVCARRPNFDPEGVGGMRDCMVVECVRRSRITRVRRPDAIRFETWGDRWD
jgi:hypothetical protein